MKKLLFQLTGLIFIIFTFSCLNGAKGPAGNTPPWEKGVIHKRILVTGDTTMSYALYIPGAPPVVPAKQSHESSGKGRYPVIIAFDPHGSGELPVSLYKTLANKYGFILVGSNDSRNGLPPDQVTRIVKSLRDEVQNTLDSDTSRIYLAGFSGGARVAATAAFCHVKVAGVIGCGAGLGRMDQPAVYTPDYFGIAGTADFNMHEMLQLDGAMQQAGIRHVISTYPGKHEWPPSGVMEKAIRWFLLNDMKDGKLSRDETLISETAAAFDTAIGESVKQNQIPEAAALLREEISFLDGLFETNPLQTRLAGLEKDPVYLTQTRYRQELAVREEAEKEELMQAVTTERPEWWQNKIAVYDRRSADCKGMKTQCKPEDTLKDRRVLSFLSLYCYMSANSAMAQQNAAAGFNILSIYEIVDPANPEPNYLKAVLFARNREFPQSFAQLKISAGKGFTDKSRLAGQPEFAEMKKYQEWSDLQAGLK